MTLGRKRPRGARTRRRGVAMIALTVALAAAAVLAPQPAEACACGAALTSDGYDVAVNREVAVVAWDGATEEILLQLDMMTEADDAALLIPTPAPAEVALADPAVFDALEEMTAPRTEVRYSWWPENGAGGSGAGDGAPGSAAVDVMSTVELGPLEVSVLSASDADGLATWLDEHSYVMGDAVAEALLPYVAEGWYYVAVRLNPEADALAGSIQPLHLSFDADSMLYPMRISAAAAADQFVRTYVIAEQQVQRTDPSWDSITGDLRYAGPLDPDDVSDPTLTELAGDGAYLTVFDQWFYNPGSEIVSDFTFGPTSGGADYHPVQYETRMREILGLPAGPVLVAIGGIAAFGALAAASVISRRRREVTPEPVSRAVENVGS
ncbi:DUF2330 domain-containing protein [Ruania halotolerans]|uniref:DUF2330 domain-containing protein n=1 Tax=Ruania halotolerans TaxID=2897773 RepID=UPI001E2E0927|nr:DUF2330 domain-containing protein [Ruania halotolerans]UFU06365.1 DUF2330 domain-containing protein [Ruania halotolerans]